MDLATSGCEFCPLALAVVSSDGVAATASGALAAIGGSDIVTGSGIGSASSQ